VLRKGLPDRGRARDHDARPFHDEEPEILCLVCLTCFGQFDYGQVKVAKQLDEDFHTPAIYFMQLLAFAQGVLYEKLESERQRLKPECLTRYQAGVPS
jgi:heterodisulfide reductase subunit B